MKRLIALTLVTLGVTISARAQWIVYDPTMNMQQIMAQAQNIAKYIQMIQNQVQQIQTLTDQLNEFKHYESLFGDRAKPIEAQGQPFDPNLHQAMFEVPGTGQPNGTVVQVLQAGYVIHDRLLRPALVGVAKAPQVRVDIEG